MAMGRSVCTIFGQFFGVKIVRMLQEADLSDFETGVRCMFCDIQAENCNMKLNMFLIFKNK